MSATIEAPNGVRFVVSGDGRWSTAAPSNPWAAEKVDELNIAFGAQFSLGYYTPHPAIAIADHVADFMGWAMVASDTPPEPEEGAVY